MNVLGMAVKPLTPRGWEVLRRMHEHAGTDEGELVYERGQMGWLGLERVAPRTVYALLRHCAISPESTSEVGRLERYHINETGRKLLGVEP